MSSSRPSTAGTCCSRARSTRRCPWRCRRGRRRSRTGRARPAPSGQPVKRVGAVEADRGAVDQQVGGPGPLRPRVAPSSAARLAARCAVRFHSRTSAAPASSRAQTTARALPPAPRTIAVRPATGNGSAAISAGASVLSAPISPSAPKVSVLAAPIARARAVARVRQRQGRLLVGDRHVGAGESRRRGGPERSRRTARGRRAAAGSASSCSPAAASAAFWIAGERLWATGQPRTPSRRRSVICRSGGAGRRPAGAGTARSWWRTRSGSCTAWRRSTGSACAPGGRPPRSTPAPGC